MQATHKQRKRRRRERERERGRGREGKRERGREGKGAPLISRVVPTPVGARYCLDYHSWGACKKPKSLRLSISKQPWMRLLRAKHQVAGVHPMHAQITAPATSTHQGEEGHI
jgi:hypothetical protein